MSGRTLQDLTIGVSPITGKIYIGYVSKNDPHLFTSKVEVTDKVIGAMADHMKVQSELDEDFGGYGLSYGHLKWFANSDEEKVSQ